MTTLFSRMTEVRHRTAGARHESLGYLVSGGRDAPLSKLSSSELSTNGTTWAPFTQLPFALNRHCMVALDRDRVCI